MGGHADKLLCQLSRKKGVWICSNTKAGFIAPIPSFPVHIGILVDHWSLFFSILGHVYLTKGRLVPAYKTQVTTFPCGAFRGLKFWMVTTGFKFNDVNLTLILHMQALWLLSCVFMGSIGADKIIASVLHYICIRYQYNDQWSIDKMLPPGCLYVVLGLYLSTDLAKFHLSSRDLCTSTNSFTEPYMAFEWLTCHVHNATVFCIIYGIIASPIHVT